MREERFGQDCRDKFGSLKDALSTEENRVVLFENRDLKFRTEAQSIQSLDIRFLTQGSYAYGTLVRPAQPAYQEIDLDDGVYVPMPFLDGRPIFSSDGLFRIIENALVSLVKEEGWGFKRKSTCVRITLIGENAHIDLPLFAVEKEEFGELVEKYKTRTGVRLRRTANLNEAFDTVARSLRIGKGRILLADRDEDWRPSDPKEVHDWFLDQVGRYGKVLRRLCRYSKAWRDRIWADGALSSLALMALCVDALSDLTEQPSEARDDLLMLQVAEYLPIGIRTENITWKKGEAALDQNWSKEERKALAEEAEKMHEELSQALEGTYKKELVVDHLQAVFGERFPNAPEAVQISTESQTTAVLETKPVTVAMPLVGTSVSA